MPAYPVSPAPQSVFVVDDHPLMLSMLTQIIADQEGLTVCGTAQNGQEALCRIFKLHPDLILCDLVLPEMDGYALIRCLRIARINTPVVVFSSVDQRKALTALGALPRVSFVSKKADMDELLRVIRRAVAAADATALDRPVPG